MLKKIAMSVQAPLKRSEVVIATHGLFSESISKEIKPIASHFALFCDKVVQAAIGEKWQTHLQKLGLDVTLFSFPAGEAEKSRERKTQLEDALIAKHFGRDAGIIALGGGVTTDLIGYLASTFCRGVPLIHVPTTLLGMVDAAIGGKTGVNTPFGKNLVGTFYPADKILIDPTVLLSLPEEEWTNGMAEIIKYALIKSPQLFHQLHQKDWKLPSNLETIIYECILIKAQIVETDYEETSGLRRILNFGHTIAHAIELLEHYAISHGEAVAIGMLVESRISLKMGLLSLEAFQKIETLIRSFPFRLKLNQAIHSEQIHSALTSDKKSVKGVPRFVLLKQIGECGAFEGEYCTSVPLPILEEAIAWMVALFSGDSQ
jgi:3-dehydroquinate synthase